MGDPIDDATDACGVPFAHAARFVSVDPTERRFRFYELRLQETLWGGVALVRAWGRLGAPGRWTATESPDREAAGPAVARAVRRRLARGYRPVGVRCGPAAGGALRRMGRGAASLISQLSGTHSIHGPPWGRRARTAPAGLLPGSAFGNA